MEITLRQLDMNSARDRKTVENFLCARAISLDAGATYTAGVFDEEETLLATGSIAGNTLRSLAVREDMQGEGLMNTLVTHLMNEMNARGVSHVFLYTKCEYAKIFLTLGFYEIARAAPFAVLMENRKNGFSGYLRGLEQPDDQDAQSAAIVMNANPMTNGHLWLVQRAAEENARVHLFVVSEDVSLVPFSARMEIVRQATKAFPNVVVHQTESYLVSAATFPSYFIREKEDVARAHALLDAAIFVKMAQALHISRRYVGTEPFSKTTDIYNQALLETLEKAGVALNIVPRARDSKNEPISASAVRTLIKSGRLEQARALVPPSTYAYFCSEEGKKTLDKIMQAIDVTHQ